MLRPGYRLCQTWYLYHRLKDHLGKAAALCIHHFYRVGTRTFFIIHVSLRPGSASHLGFSEVFHQVLEEPLSSLPLTECILLFSPTDKSQTLSCIWTKCAEFFLFLNLTKIQRFLWLVAVCSSVSETVNAHTLTLCQCD